MARPIPCDNGDGEVAIMLATNTENGDTSAVCGACLHAWAVALADATAPPPAQDGAGAAQVDGAAGEEGGAAQTPPPRKRRQGRRQEATEDLASEGSPFIDPAPVDS